MTFVNAKTVIVGHTYGLNKVFEKHIEATALPLLKREQEVFFEYPTQDLKIKAIALKDLDNGLAEPSINRGGIGFNFVNIKLKSERGVGLNFAIELYA